MTAKRLVMVGSGRKPSKQNRAAGFWLAAAVCGLALPAAAHALTSISQGYVSSDNLSLGSMVSLQQDSSDHVSATTTANVNNILGVVIDSGNSLLSLSSGQEHQVQVATSGVVQVLVSNINGTVTSGDPVTASPLSGVGMKATSNSKVIGVAQDDMTNNNSSAESYTDKGGAKHDVRIGQLPVLVNVSYYYKQPDKTLIPSAVQNIANALAGKKVNALPILISMGIFLVTLIVVVSIIYSMIHSSIISVGRNPMSQSAVYRDLVGMSALVLGILAVAVIAIYLILRQF